MIYKLKAIVQIIQIVHKLNNIIFIIGIMIQHVHHLKDVFKEIILITYI